MSTNDHQGLRGRHASEVRGERPRRRWLGPLGSLLLAVGVAACGTIGASSVTRDRTDYTEAISTSWKEQTLGNIMRLRYGDSPVFLDVSSLISQYQLEGAVNASGTVFPGAGSNSVTMGAAGRYIDRPTVTYTPVQGDKFTKSLLRPIPPAALFQLVQAGYPIDLVFQLTVRAVNEVYNKSERAMMRREADPEFYAVLDALRRIQQSESVGFRVEKRGADDAALILFRKAVSSAVARDQKFVRETLKLDPMASDITLTFGAIQRNDREIAMLSRSMLEILLEIGASASVPADHVKDGRAAPNPVLSPTGHPRDQPLVRIQSGAERPDTAFAATRYRDRWFWIDDRDLRSKSIFTFLMMLFSLSETGVAQQAPVITIPVN